jgi:lysozyme family protein
VRIVNTEIKYEVFDKMGGIRLSDFFFWLLKRALIHEGCLNFFTHLSKGEILSTRMQVFRVIHNSNAFGDMKSNTRVAT